MSSITRLTDEVTGQVVEGILLRPDGKDPFLLESVIEEKRSSAARVTTHPVEDGTQISDHVIQQNRKFTVQVVISDATLLPGNGVRARVPQPSIIGNIINKLGFVEQFFDNGPQQKPIVVDIPEERNVASAARLTVEEIITNQELLTLRTSIGDFPNVVITGITTTRNAKASNRVFNFTLNLEQIQIVSEAATIAFVEKKPDVEDEAAAKGELGAQGQGELDNSVAFETREFIREKKGSIF